MQELRLKSRMMKRIEDRSQKNRRNDAERFFERHPEETVDECHLKNTGYDDVCGAVQVLH